MSDFLLEVNDLHTHFTRKDGIVKAVDGITYALARGETLAIVGESGSGKSVCVNSVMRLLRTGRNVRSWGEAKFKGRDLFRMREREIRTLRGSEMSMIFQDPMSSLNPTMKIGEQIIEPLIWHGKASRSEARRRGIELLGEVGISSPETRFNAYPFEFSGGMLQRAMIAMALICSPDLLIADEPTTALDVTVQAQILSLIKGVQKKHDTAVILITHDLAVASSFCDRVIVMYAGHIMEAAPMAEFISNPAHPYARGLLNSTPVLGAQRDRLEAIKGQPPNLKKVPAGCPFSPRCAQCMDICRKEAPPTVTVGSGHTVCCWLDGGEEGRA